MARYEYLPIYKKAFDLAVYFEKVGARYYKRTPWHKVAQRFRRVVAFRPALQENKGL